MELSVLYEDNHLIAVNKPSGLLAQGDRTGDEPMAVFVKAYIKKKYKKPGDVFLGIIHRLDRPVSGVTIFARTSKALTRMNELFRNKTIVKKYVALVDKTPPKNHDRLLHYLIKDHKRNKVSAYQKATKNSKESITEYELLSKLSGIYVLKVSPITGRAHQIRSQLSITGMPIVGDLKYGSKKRTGDQSIGLHCYSLHFIHPVKKEPVTITANPPNGNFWNLFNFEELLIFD